MQMFNNREIAIAIWIFIALCIVFYKPALRESIINVFRSLFSLQILVPYLTIVLYVFVGVWILYYAKLWTIDQLKATILWLLFTL
jgi:hypothetical protein